MFSSKWYECYGINVVSKAKWKTTIGWGRAKEAPILSNDVPTQGLYGTPSPLWVHFFPSFPRRDPEDSPYHRMESQSAEKISLPRLRCWQLRHEIRGTQWRFSAAEMYACVVLKMHTHSLYSQPDLSMSNILTEEIKNCFFCDTCYPAYIVLTVVEHISFRTRAKSEASHKCGITMTNGLCKFNI